MNPNRTAQTLLPIFALLGLIGLSACNTIAGAGKDVSATGDAVTDTANEVKKDL